MFQATFECGGVDILVGNNHTADGTAEITKISGNKDAFKVDYMKRALLQGCALAASQGIEHAMVVGDWSMGHKHVERALVGMGTGTWETSHVDAQSEFIVANCAIEEVKLVAPIRTWGAAQHQARIAQMPLRHRGAGDDAEDAGPPDDESQQEAAKILDLLHARRASILEAEMREQNEAAELDERIAALKNEQTLLESKRLHLCALKALNDLSSPCSVIVASQCETIAGALCHHAADIGQKLSSAMDARRAAADRALRAAALRQQWETLEQRIAAEERASQDERSARDEARLQRAAKANVVSEAERRQLAEAEGRERLEELQAEEVAERWKRARREGMHFLEEQLAAEEEEQLVAEDALRAEIERINSEQPPVQELEESLSRQQQHLQEEIDEAEAARKTMDVAQDEARRGVNHWGSNPQVAGGGYY